MVSVICCFGLLVPRTCFVDVLEPTRSDDGTCVHKELGTDVCWQACWPGSFWLLDAFVVYSCGCSIEDIPAIDPSPFRGDPLLREGICWFLRKLHRALIRLQGDQSKPVCAVFRCSFQVVLRRGLSSTRVTQVARGRGLYEQVAPAGSSYSAALLRTASTF
jgi:hypothetical protein